MIIIYNKFSESKYINLNILWFDFRIQSQKIIATFDQTSMFFDILSPKQLKDIRSIAFSSEKQINMDQLYLISLQSDLLKQIAAEINQKTHTLIPKNDSQKTVPGTESSLDLPNLKLTNLLPNQESKDSVLSNEQCNEVRKENLTSQVKCYPSRCLTDRSVSRVSCGSFLDGSLTQMSLAFRIDQGQLSNALQQVRINCSDICFELLQKIVMFRTEQRPYLKKLVQREVRSNKQLKARCLQLNEENLKLKIEAQRINEIISRINQQKLKFKKQENSQIERQKMMVQFEATILTKIKMEQQCRKKMRKQMSLLSQQRQHLETLRDYIFGETENFKNRMSKGDKDQIDHIVNQGSISSIQVISNCRKSLAKQRKLLQEQQKQVEKYHQKVDFLINQLKKTFQLEKVLK